MLRPAELTPTMIPQHTFTDWHKSSFSDPDKSCVEVGYAPGHVAVRDTKDRSKGAHVFTAAEWTAFISSAKYGKFDL